MRVVRGSWTSHKEALTARNHLSGDVAWLVLNLPCQRQSSSLLLGSRRTRARVVDDSWDLATSYEMVPKHNIALMQLLWLTLRTLRVRRRDGLKWGRGRHEI